MATTMASVPYQLKLPMLGGIMLCRFNNSGCRSMFVCLGQSLISGLRSVLEIGSRDLGK